MSNINDYIRKYKNISFEEEGFNEVDNLVFCILTYLDFSNIVSNRRKYIKLSSAGKKYLDKNSFISISKYGISQIQAYNILKQIIDSVRYKDVLLYSYVYISDINKQFGAMSFKITKDLTFVAFEGTDYLLSGWKEDFQMSYKFPVPSQYYAIKYLNKNVGPFDKNIIVGGHSKGGNLALVSSMYCRGYINKKIKAIYNNDGQGLRKEELESENYKRIKDRHIHIVPNYSYVGILLKNDNYKVIKSSRRDAFAHSIMTWKIKDNKLVPSKLSTISKNLRKSTNIWLDKHDDITKKEIITNIFNALEESNIYDSNDFLNLTKWPDIIKNIDSIDEETKILIINLLKFNIEYLINNLKTDIMKMII